MKTKAEMLSLNSWSRARRWEERILLLFPKTWGPNVQTNQSGTNLMHILIVEGEIGLTNTWMGSSFQIHAGTCNKSKDVSAPRNVCRLHGNQR
jgi:hypothetical protein